MRDLYKILNVREDATFKEIEDAYQNTLSGIDQEDLDKIKLVEYAHYVLSDIEKREEYDKKRAEIKENPSPEVSEAGSENKNIKKGYALANAIVSGILTAFSLIFALVFLATGGGAAALGGVFLFSTLLYGVILVLAIFSLVKKQKVFAKSNFVYVLVIFCLSTIGTITNITTLLESEDKVDPSLYVSTIVGFLIIVAILVLAILDYRQYKDKK